jgi:hypothetical protein
LLPIPTTAVSSPTGGSGERALEPADFDKEAQSFRIQTGANHKTNGPKNAQIFLFQNKVFPNAIVS